MSKGRENEEEPRSTTGDEDAESSKTNGSKGSALITQAELEENQAGFALLDL